MATNNALREQIFHLTLAIFDYQATLDELYARRRVLQSRLDSIVYPILTLPPEITSEIFIHCLPAVEEEAKDISILHAPLALTRVCAAWRRIAISTPALWTKFCVNVDVHSPDVLVEVTQNWLKRSACCPVSVELSGETFDSSMADSFLSAFQRHTPRVQSLELHLDARFIHRMDTRLSSSGFPLLQNLVLHFDSDWEDLHLDSDSEDDNLNLPVTAMFSVVPLLRSLTFSMIIPSFVTLPWQQLTRFVATSYFDDDCLEVLRLAPNLTFSRFEILDSVCNNELHHVHDYVQSLELVEHLQSDFIRHLTLPALQTFYWAPPQVQTMDWSSFLQRSSPPLRQLMIEIRHGPTVNFELSGAFARLPLTDLEIGRPYLPFVTSFLRLLGSDPTFLPQLSALHFMDCCDLDEENTVPQMVHTAGHQLQDRWIASSSAQCARLMEFHVDISSRSTCVDFSNESLSMLDRLKKDGVDVRIRWSQYSII